MTTLSRRGLLAGAGAFTVSGTLAGCATSLGPGPAPQTFNLSPNWQLDPAARKTSAQFSVAMPDALRSLDTDRIALMRSPRTVEYYANVIWSDRLPRLVQDALVEGFIWSGGHHGVAREEDGMRADFIVQTTITQFEASYAGSGLPVANVNLEVRLMTPSRDLVYWDGFSRTVPATANDLPSVVAAFDSALQNAIVALVAMVLSQGATAEPDVSMTPASSHHVRHRRRRHYR